MSSASTALGALAVLSIMLVTTAGTGSSAGTGHPGAAATSASPVAEHQVARANGTTAGFESPVTSGTSNRPTAETTATTTPATTTVLPLGGLTLGNDTDHPSEHPEIVGTTTTGSTSSQINEAANAEAAKATATPTPMSPPRQERLIGLVQNGTAASEGPALGSKDGLSRGGAESTTATEAPATATSADVTGTEATMAMLTVARTATSTTPVPTLLLAKGAASSKNRNELGPTFHEIKPAQKMNSKSQGYIGGKIVKPNLASALGKYAPYFEDGQEELNVTARIGNTVLLDCEIGMLGNKTVTWSYHSDDVFRLLTVGRNAYSVDQRINLYFKYPTNWRLRIQYATPRDSGLYECQVATYPLPLVKKIYLLVTAPILVIMDDSGRIKSGERHLKAGSALRLRCEARDVPERYNETVIWTRGDEILSEDISENRTTEYLDGREIQVIVSTLIIEKATTRHAGNYSCMVPEKAKTTVAVHVLNGELPAAVHDGNGVSKSVLNIWLVHLTISYVFSR